LDLPPEGGSHKFNFEDCAASAADCAASAH
jgi:hypothetical protein